jgi:hypothetical protein
LVKLTRAPEVSGAKHPSSLGNRRIRQPPNHSIRALQLSFENDPPKPPIDCPFFGMASSTDCLSPRASQRRLCDHNERNSCR